MKVFTHMNRCYKCLITIITICVHEKVLLVGPTNKLNHHKKPQNSTKYVMFVSLHSCLLSAVCLSVLFSHLYLLLARCLT